MSWFTVFTTQVLTSNRGLDIIDVVVDPYLSSKMRAHQKEGVKVSSVDRSVC